MAGTETVSAVREALQSIAKADWRTWDEGLNTPEEFVRWAQSIARTALAAPSAAVERVPREPTPAMIDAGYRVLGEPDNESPVRNAWRAMYDAAMERKP